MDDILCDDDQRCPKCGSLVRQDVDCPGYGTPRELGGTGVKVCHPVCGNAWLYECTSDACDWWFRDPTNPYRHDLTRMGERPPWLRE